MSHKFTARSHTNTLWNKLQLSDMSLEIIDIPSNTFSNNFFKPFAQQNAASDLAYPRHPPFDLSPGVVFSAAR